MGLRAVPQGIKSVLAGRGSGDVGYLPQLVLEAVTVESWHLCGLPEPRCVRP